MGVAAAARQSHAGLIVREADPRNLESPFGELQDFLTPNEIFYVRSHFPAPEFDLGRFALEIGGAVERPFSIGYEELLRLPSVTRAATLECAGNGRAFLSPPVEGVQWRLGAVSTAEWTGVPLPDLLRRAGMADSACEIIFEAADKGTPSAPPVPPGETRYARSIPAPKAQDVLVAYAMNGEPLSPDHGFPLRAIVPGYYAMASVKWLTRIRAADQPFMGYWQTTDYACWDIVDGNPLRRPLYGLELKSSIARPCPNEVVPAGQPYTVFGAAWGGSAPIEQVELSVDGGKTWQRAAFLDPPRPFVWRRWQYRWDVPPNRGAYGLKSRARNAAGHVQPIRHDPRFGAYVIDHILGIEVQVE